MNGHDFGSHDESQKHKEHGNFEDKVHYLLSGEEQLLQSIFARAPLPEVLNGICTALDCQIGNVVSLIPLPGDEATDLAEAARVAALFGLYSFCSAGVVAENGELLGSLEMYSCVPGSPSPREFQLIRRATCLAAIGIKLDNEADQQGNCGMHGNRLVSGHLLQWPVSMN